MYVLWAISLAQPGALNQEEQKNKETVLRILKEKEGMFSGARGYSSLKPERTFCERYSKLWIWVVFFRKGTGLKKKKKKNHSMVSGSWQADRPADFFNT